MNPKIFLTIETANGKHFLLPMRGQSSLLDKAFRGPEVRTANIDGYNEYTKDFIEQNKSAKGEAFWSTDYSFDPVKFVFNFNSLCLCVEDDWNEMAAGSKFDAHERYEIGGTVKAATEEKKVSYAGKAKAVAGGPRLLETIKKDFPCPTVNETGFYVEERNWNFLVRNIIRKQNTILIGPTGTGKTEIISRICEILGMDLSIYDMGAMQDPMTCLLGSHRIINGDSVFDYAKFVSDIQKPGVILLDELSRATLSANNILFPCLDSRRTLYCELADSKHDRSFKVHPDCVFIATANIGSEYSGTNDIDAALLNRFIPLQLDYLPAEIEASVLVKRTGISAINAEKLVNFFNIIRGKYQAGDLSKSVSTREAINCAEMVVDGFSLIDAIDFIISNKYINNNYNQEYSEVKQIIAGC